MRSLIFTVLFLCLSGTESFCFADEISLESYGLHKGMSYRQAKEILEKNNWSPTVEDGSKPTFVDFPEINCGEGYNAICSVGFEKGKSEMAIVVKRNKNFEFIVDDSY